MRIAVTGGSGFIGTKTVELLSREHEVVSVDINPPEQKGSFEFRRADLTSYEVAQESLQNFDVIYHLAGVVLDFVRKDPFLGSELNVDMTRNVVEAARKNNIPKLIFASSFYVYDGISDSMIVNEATPLNTLDMELFGATKVFCENLVKEYNRKYGLKYVILRYGSAYGSGKCTNVIKTFVETALAGQTIEVWGPGNRRNQYTYVDDLAHGSVLALKEENEIFNLISPEETSIRQLIDVISTKIQAKTSFNLQKKEGASMPYMASRKATTRMKWTPTSLENGIDHVIHDISLLKMPFKTN